MTKESLNEAIFEARRFLGKALNVQDNYKKNHFIFFGSKETGAAKRASMDLSRALTILRSIK